MTFLLKYAFVVQCVCDYCGNKIARFRGFMTPIQRRAIGVS